MSFTGTNNGESVDGRGGRDGVDGHLVLLVQVIVSDEGKIADIRLLSMEILTIFLINNECLVCAPSLES